MQSEPFNIILFGEGGVGKSSIINLLADEDIAETSPDAMGCTLESTRYTFPVLWRTFSIWDTVGLGEAETSDTNYSNAIVKAYTLIQEIQAAGGLDLLLFCISGGHRISETILSNYRLFYEVLCRGRIPIAVVVTKLELEEGKMDAWWERNESFIEKCGLKFSGHACVTGLRKHPKAEEGRDALTALLSSGDRDGHFVMPSALEWYSVFLKGLSTFSRLARPKLKQKHLERLLRERCKLDGASAQKLAEEVTRGAACGRRARGKYYQGS